MDGRRGRRRRRRLPRSRARPILERPASRFLRRRLFTRRADAAGRAPDARRGRDCDAGGLGRAPRHRARRGQDERFCGVVEVRRRDARAAAQGGRPELRHDVPRAGEADRGPRPQAEHGVPIHAAPHQLAVALQALASLRGLDRPSRADGPSRRPARGDGRRAPVVRARRRGRQVCSRGSIGGHVGRRAHLCEERLSRQNLRARARAQDAQRRRSHRRERMEGRLRGQGDDGARCRAAAAVRVPLPRARAQRRRPRLGAFAALPSLDDHFDGDVFAEKSGRAIHRRLRRRRGRRRHHPLHGAALSGERIRRRRSVARWQSGTAGQDFGAPSPCVDSAHARGGQDSRRTRPLAVALPVAVFQAVPPRASPASGVVHRVVAPGGAL
mmetsp:Transcript_18052/g.60874  ORF Transcript_18052/g.60874 Transcript_18052/m.60874 type:complete len:384 (+) Transcript_18052:3768-4919(+)